MLGRRLLCFSRSPPAAHFSSSAKSLEEGKAKSLGRKAVPFVLISLSGGVALSAINDLAIYRGCSSKAMEKASRNQAIIDALGEPIVKGPWYGASLAVAHKRQSASCTFPISGPQGSGVLQLKAIHTGAGGSSWFPSLRHKDWEIVLMEALLHIPANDEKQRTLRISISDQPPPPPKSCPDCISQNSENHKKK